MIFPIRNCQEKTAFSGLERSRVFVYVLYSFISSIDTVVYIPYIFEAIRYLNNPTNKDEVGQISRDLEAKFGHKRGTRPNSDALF